MNAQHPKYNEHTHGSSEEPSGDEPQHIDIETELRREELAIIRESIDKVIGDLGLDDVMSVHLRELLCVYVLGLNGVETLSRDFKVEELSFWVDMTEKLDDDDIEYTALGFVAGTPASYAEIGVEDDLGSAYDPVFDNAPEDVVNSSVSGIVYNLVEGLSGYIVLVEAGYINRPTFLYGDTNPAMAHVSKKFGFYRATELPKLIAEKQGSLSDNELTELKEALDFQPLDDLDPETWLLLYRLVATSDDTAVSGILTKVFLGDISPTVFSEENENIVYARYGDMKEAVLTYGKQVHPKLQRRILRAAQNVVSLASDT